MGMFDDYRPSERFLCPWCGGSLIEGWQGQDGPCWLLPWVQGHRYPVVPPNAGYTLREDKATAVLPELFVIYTTCVNGHWVEAEGQCIDGVWRRTRLFEESEYTGGAGYKGDTD
ncbi:hypothetical protein [Nonomuraea turcica]|uniref:hypothetical protein n=1 Tax=Nonomuraea sp. G32 TaxID=3067274 RepID=UPI00273C4DA4|nr:hypothetical protein [Nonomuraea sp. G32]MDP4500759.1 hypothetical protein [Nonomuraea sp. G32]